jgi:hypothetical protein
MTEAARRKAVTKPASRLPVGAPVLWLGLALGTFLAVAALTHGVMLPGFGGFLDAVLTFVLLLFAGVVLAELVRRHHRAAARHAIRHGKRGALAAARRARRHGRAVHGWLVAKTASRWASREHRPLMFRKLREGEVSGTRRLDGEPETDADKRFFDLRDSGYTGPINQDGYAVSDPPANTPGGPVSMAVSRIAPERRARRTAAHTGGSIPSEWGPVVAQAADFEPESDADLLDWMAGQVTGMAAYAEALIEAYETGVGTVGIDPKGLAALHDVADAAAHAAETMGAAKAKFTEHYELPREFAGNGGLMTHDGRWITGEGA